MVGAAFNVLCEHKNYLHDIFTMQSKYRVLMQAPQAIGGAGIAKFGMGACVSCHKQVPEQRKDELDGNIVLLSAFSLLYDIR